MTGVLHTAQQWQHLYIVFSLSVTFLDSEKPKCFHTSYLKLARAFEVSQILPLGSLLQRFHSTKDVGHAWTDGNCSSHFFIVCFTASEKAAVFTKKSYRLKLSTRTSRHFGQHRLVDTINIPDDAFARFGSAQYWHWYPTTQKLTHQKLHIQRRTQLFTGSLGFVCDFSTPIFKKTYRCIQPQGQLITCQRQLRRTLHLGAS